LREGDLRLGSSTRTYSDEVPAGRVVEQSIAPGRDAAPMGSQIDVVLSRGPFPVPVPKVTRMPEDEAVAALVAEGFEPSVSHEYSDDVPRGLVVSQDPRPRAELQPGNAVAIVVSLGPEQFPLPSFLGMSKDAAVAQIRDLGLVPRVFPVPGGNANTVISQLPGAGTTVRVGDSVAIYVA
jgi:serine/threonine-protein kinase